MALEYISYYDYVFNKVSKRPVITLVSGLDQTVNISSITDYKENASAMDDLTEQCKAIDDLSGLGAFTDEGIYPSWW